MPGRSAASDSACCVANVAGRPVAILSFCMPRIRCRKFDFNTMHITASHDKQCHVRCTYKCKMHIQRTMNIKSIVTDDRVHKRSRPAATAPRARAGHLLQQPQDERLLGLVPQREKVAHVAHHLTTPGSSTRRPARGEGPCSWWCVRRVPPGTAQRPSDWLLLVRSKSSK